MGPKLIVRSVPLQPCRLKNGIVSLKKCKMLAGPWASLLLPCFAPRRRRGGQEGRKGSKREGLRRKMCLDISGTLFLLSDTLTQYPSVSERPSTQWWNVSKEKVTLPIREAELASMATASPSLPPSAYYNRSDLKTVEIMSSVWEHLRLSNFTCLNCSRSWDALQTAGHISGITVQLLLSDLCIQTQPRVKVRWESGSWNRLL